MTIARKQIEKIIDELNVTLDQIKADQREANRSGISTLAYQSYTTFYEQVQTMQQHLKSTIRAFDRAQIRGARIT